MNNSLNLEMKTMSPRLREYYEAELAAYRKSLNDGDKQQAWRHLERAHILAQAYPIPHSEVHWLMLKFGVREGDGHEIAGQTLRLAFGGIKSAMGNVPVGNTGGANVPPLSPMPIPEDLQRMIMNS